MSAAARRRRSARIAAAGSAVLLAGLVPGGDSRAEEPAAPAPIPYTCGTGAGSFAVQAVVRQRYPQAAAVGAPIRPGEIAVTLTLPPAAAAALLPAGSTAVTGTVGLGVRISQGSSADDVVWPVTVGTVPLAADGGAELTARGPATAVTVTAPGAVRFDAGVLELGLHPAPAGAAGPSPAQPSATPSAAAPAAGAADPDTPGAVAAAASAAVSVPGAVSASGGTAAKRATVRCTPDAGAPTRLGSVDVPAPAPAAPASPAPGAPQAPVAGGGPAASALAALPPAVLRKLTTGQGPAGTIRTLATVPSGVNTCPPAPTGDLDPARLPAVPAGAMVIPFPDMDPFPDVPACAFAVGLANVHKLGQAAAVNDPHGTPALAAINMTRRFVTLWDPEPGQQPYLEADSLGYLRLPPSDTTFLTYGFIPTTAKMQLVPQGLLTIVATGNSDWDQPIEFTIGGYQSLRLYDVRVNGTPLDVGPNCRTVRPVDLKLRGTQDSHLGDRGDGRPDYSLQTGGPLSQDGLTVPPFTGCGTGGEDLSPLFTAAVSGTGNSLNLVQGPICTPTSEQPNGCEPEIALPELPHR
ncbi:hypothetical protein KNE206_67180 [Kitasatospora sp. NE20-6]|uniref:DUF6801 domain-containing protein n=1 Tax=Kitasatospora sp. NE20-6 TaxID=2859066 RepID=UPI0034DBD72B